MITIDQLLSSLEQEIIICKTDGSDWMLYLSRMYQREVIRLLKLKLKREIGSLEWQFWQETGIWLDLPHIEE